MSDVSEGFESDGSWDLDSDSSGPQIDRYPRVRKGRVLRFCRQCASTSTGENAGASGADGCALTAAGGGSDSLALAKAPRAKAKERVAPTVGEPGPGLLDLGVTALQPTLQEQVHPPNPHPTRGLPSS